MGEAHTVNVELLKAQAQTAQTAETARAVRKTAHTAQRRELPNRASCHTARTAQRRDVPDGDNGADIEGRELPNSAYCQTAQGNDGDAPFVVAVVVAVGHLAPSGSSRRMAARAVWQFAP